MPDPIGDYLAERDSIHADWAREGERYKLLREAGEDPPYGNAHKEYQRRLAECRERHFPKLPVGDVGRAPTLAHLWLMIEDHIRPFDVLKNADGELPDYYSPLLGSWDEKEARFLQAVRERLLYFGQGWEFEPDRDCGSYTARQARTRLRWIAVQLRDLSAAGRLTGPWSAPDKDPNVQRVEGASPGPEDVGATTSPPSAKKLKEPSGIDFAAYRYHKLGGLDQTTTGKRITEDYGKTFDQSQVSRAVARVARWREAGKPLKPAPAPLPKSNTMDPSKLEQGRRRDGRRRS